MIKNFRMNPDNLSLQYIKSHAREAAREIERLDDNKLSLFLLSLPCEDAASLIRYMMPTRAARSLETLDTGQAAEILRYLPPDTVSRLLRRVKKQTHNEIISSLPVNISTLLKLTLRYPHGMVGSLMDPNVLVIPADVSVKDALEYARQERNKLKSVIYIVNDLHKLLGHIDLGELVVEDGNTRISKLIKETEFRLSARSSLASIRDHPGWKQSETLPVVDHDGIFQGVLTRVSLDGAFAETQGNIKLDNEITNTVLALADIFWSTCAEFFIKEPNKMSRDNHEKK